MTPTEAEHLRDLFYAARQTTRDAVLGRPEAYSADDAAVEAFNTALREYTKQGGMSEFAEAIVNALSECDELYQDGGYIDDDDLSNTCIDEWFNLERVAEKLTAMGYGRHH